MENRTVNGLVKSEGTGGGNPALVLSVQTPHDTGFKKLLLREGIEHIEYSNPNVHTFRIYDSKLIDAFRKYKEGK